MWCGKDAGRDNIKAGGVLKSKSVLKGELSNCFHTERTWNLISSLILTRLRKYSKMHNS